jgi:8-oxo-dGTP diphosphatase
MKRQKLIEIKFYNPEDVDDCRLKYAVIMARYMDGWLFVRHKLRETWEIPGGRREIGENIQNTAERELVEETGASSFQIYPICIYSVSNVVEESCGFLYYADNIILGKKLLHEICEVKLFQNLPEDLTYPTIQPYLFEKVLCSISGNA